MPLTVTHGLLSFHCLLHFWIKMKTGSWEFYLLRRHVWIREAWSLQLVLSSCCIITTNSVVLLLKIQVCFMLASFGSRTSGSCTCLEEFNNLAGLCHINLSRIHVILECNPFIQCLCTHRTVICTSDLALFVQYTFGECQNHYLELRCRNSLTVSLLEIWEDRELQLQILNGLVFLELFASPRESIFFGWNPPLHVVVSA